MYSPRMALVWTPTEKDAVKFIGSQSLRTNTEETMRSLWINNQTKSPPEKMNSLELRYERQQTENLFLASSIYYNKLDVFGWMVGMGRYGNVGSYKMAGIEFEGTYRTKNTSFTFSHGYSKLVGQDFEIRNFITSAWMGYGYDLGNWSNNVTKLTAHHQIDPKWSVDGSLQIMWGYQGGEDNMKFHNTDAYYLSKHTLPDAVDGYDDAFGMTAFLNMGVQYKLDKHATVRLDAYNILGWVDETLNKDFVFGSVWEGAYRVQPPAIGITFQYSF
jgi:outer membrane receptor protein involved in Fe transport